MKPASSDICKRLSVLRYDGDYRYFLVQDRDGYCAFIRTYEYDWYEDPDNYKIIGAAPNLYEISDWLRKEHNLNVVINHKILPNKYPWYYELQRMNTDEFLNSHQLYPTYEEAFAKAIVHALYEIENRNG